MWRIKGGSETIEKRNEIEIKRELEAIENGNEFGVKKALETIDSNKGEHEVAVESKVEN